MTFLASGRLRRGGLLIGLLVLSWADAQSPAPVTPPLALDQFRPRSQLRVASHERSSARFPVVDVHTHLGLRLRGSREQLDAYIALMDRCHVAVTVNLDVPLNEKLEEELSSVWKDHRQRVVNFVHVDWQGDGADDDPAAWDCQRPDFARRTVAKLKQARAHGVSGLKVFKQFGLGYRDADGTLLKIDDPRWDPIWAACGELGLPILIHTGDPAAFFEPIDEFNERWEELHRHPEWSFHGNGFPSRKELLAARNRVIARHPNTQFIGAHVANNAEDLAEVTKWLRDYPNLVVDITSRIGELGRQPYTARQFFLDHADRILFGTDGPKPEARMRLYFRFLETEDEYFPYSEQPFPPQGFWNIYGIGLPDDVLRKIYYENASRIIPGVRERLPSGLID